MAQDEQNGDDYTKGAAEDGTEALSSPTSTLPADYTPPPVPKDDGYYWAYLLWRFDMGRMQTIIEVRGGRLFALTLIPGETPEYGPAIPHDVIEWGPKLEFPEVPE